MLVLDDVRVTRASSWGARAYLVSMLKSTYNPLYICETVIGEKEAKL